MGVAAVMVMPYTDMKIVAALLDEAKTVAIPTTLPANEVSPPVEVPLVESHDISRIESPSKKDLKLGKYLCI